MPNPHKEKHDKELRELRRYFRNFIPNPKGIVSEINIPKAGGGDIDLAICYSSTLIQLELKTSSGKQLISQFDEFLGKYRRQINFLRQDKLFKKSKVRKDINLFCIPRVSKSIEDLLIKRLDHKSDPTVFIIRKHHLTAFEQLAKSVSPEYASNEFLKEFNGWTKVADKFLVPAIVSPLSKNSYIYQFSCSAKQLARFATVSRRTDTKSTLSSYQRMVDGSRLKEIAKNHLNKGGDFVNSVVIKVDNSKINFISYDAHLEKTYTDYQKSKSGIQRDIQFGILKIDMDVNSAFIIDGQHRLLSYYHSDEDGLIRVSALVNIDETAEAKYFLDINDKAKSVDKDLIWDLVGVMSPRTDRGMISRLVKDLNTGKNDSIFKNALNPPSHPKPKSKLKFSFSGICRTISDDLREFHHHKWASFQGKKFNNPFYKKNYEVDEMSKAIAVFFNAITAKMDDEKKEKFFSNGVVAVYLELAFIFYRSMYDSKIKSQKQDILDFLSEYAIELSPNEIKARREMSNAADKKEHLNLLIKHIQDSFTGFGPAITLLSYDERFMEFEGKFCHWFNKKMTDYTENDNWLKDSGLISDSDIKSWEKKQQRWKTTKGRDRPLYTFIGYGKIVDLMGIKKNPKYPLWDAVFEEVILGLGYADDDHWKKMMEIMSEPRNPPAHGHKNMVYKTDLQKVADEQIEKMEVVFEKYP